MPDTLRDAVPNKDDSVHGINLVGKSSCSAEWYLDKVMTAATFDDTADDTGPEVLNVCLLTGKLSRQVEHVIPICPSTSQFM